MINLTLADGQPLDIPVQSILCVEETDGKGKGCQIVYQLETGRNLHDVLEDGYGWVRKSWLEQSPQINPLEMTIAGDRGNRKITLDTTAVVARRGLTESTNGANTRVTVTIGGPLVSLDVVDTRDSIAGEK